MTDDQQRQAFLDAIAADRYDQTTRLVFADWLNERGMDSEAEVQRAWTREKQEAEDFIADFAAELGQDVCDLMVGDQKFEKVPIFYHPPKTYADNWKLNADAQADYWKVSGALVDAQGEDVGDIPEEGLVFKDQAVARGAYSFSVDDEVAVRLQEGNPVAVISPSSMAHVEAGIRYVLGI